MPPQITFIKLDDRLTVPVKIFVNRNTVLSVSDISINSKSLITLNNNYFQIKLSNNYLNSLFNDTLNKKIAEVLFEKPLNEIVNLEPSENIKISNIIDSINYKLSIPKILCLTVRCRLNLLTSQDYTYLSLINQGNFSEKVLQSDFQMNLLVNTSQFVKLEPSLLVESDEEMPQDTKKLVQMDLQQLNLLNNLKNCIKLYLLNH
jgi:hypothetical protein